MAGKDVIACVIGKTGLSSSEAKKLSDDFEAYLGRYDGDISTKTSEAFNSASSRAKDASMLKKRNKLFQEKYQRIVDDRISGYREQGLSNYKSVSADLVGTVQSVEGARVSGDSHGKVKQNQIVGRFVKDLEAEGLLTALKSKDLDEEIAEGVFALSGGESSRSISKEAKRISELIHNMNEMTRAMTNKAGGYIRKRKGFITNQTHSRFHIKRAGKEAWINSVSPLLDWQKMGIADAESRMRLLSSTYDDVMNGTYFTSENITSNTAGRLSKGRVFQFTTPDAWLKYNKQFGGGSLMRSVVSNYERVARDIAMIERYGPNPRATINSVVSEANMTPLQQRKINAFADALDGSADIAVDPTLAAIGQWARAFQIMTKMGGSIFTYTLDLPIKVAKANRQAGMGYFESFSQSYSDIFKSVKSGDKKIVAESYAAGLEGIIGAIGNGGFSINGEPGAASAALRVFFKANLNDWWLNTVKPGAIAMQTSAHAAQAGKTYNELADTTKNLFKRYGIDDNDWDLIRKGVEKLPETGRKYIMSDSIPDKAVGEKYRRMVIDYTDQLVLTPGTYEKVAATLGTRPGTIEGELARLVMQFKSFPITYITKVWGEALYSGEKADIPQILMLSGMLMGATYLADTLRGAAQGKTPPDPTNASYVRDVIVRSGMGGIYGDVVLGYALGGRRESFTDSLLGPGLGEVNDLASVMRGDKDLSRFLVKQVPGQNLFYVRPALDYIFLNQMFEHTNPGFSERIKGYNKKYRGQEFYDTVLAPDRQLFGGNP